MRPTAISDELQGAECAEEQLWGRMTPLVQGELRKQPPPCKVKGKSEKPQSTELQRDPEACQPAPHHTGLPNTQQLLQLDACVTILLKELVCFQDPTYQDPVKATTKCQFE